MKKLLTFFAMVIGMMIIATTDVQAQESTVMISFIDEEGYTVDYDLTTLASLIATSDTLVDDDGWFMREYESVFPATRGSHEPAVLILLPDDHDVIAIFVQATRKDRILSFRMLTNHGWLEADKSCLTSLHFH